MLGNGLYDHDHLIPCRLHMRSRASGITFGLSGVYSSSMLALYRWIVPPERLSGYPGHRRHRYFGCMSFRSALQTSPVVSLYSVFPNKETVTGVDTMLPFLSVGLYTSIKTGVQARSLNDLRKPTHHKKDKPVKTCKKPSLRLPLFIPL